MRNSSFKVQIVGRRRGWQRASNEAALLRHVCHHPGADWHNLANEAIVLPSGLAVGPLGYMDEFVGGGSADAADAVATAALPPLWSCNPFQPVAPNDATASTGAPTGIAATH